MVSESIDGTRLRLAILLFFLLVARTCVSATPTLVDGKPVRITDKTMLEDQSGNLTIEDILARPGAADFHPTARELFGFSHSAFWFRCEIVVAPGIRDLSLISDFHRMDSFDVWMVGADGRPVQLVRHRALEEGGSSQTGRLPTFALPLEPGTTGTLYLRERSIAFICARFFIMDHAALLQRELAFTWLYAAIFGAMLVILAYNLMIWFSLRERVYAVYILYLSVIFAFNFLYYGAAYSLFFHRFGPHYWAWFARSYSLLYALSAATVVIFTLEFLSLRRGWPVRVLQSYVTLMAFDTLGLWTGLIGTGIFYPFANALTFVACLFILYLGVRRLREGYRPALFYTFAWSFWVLGASLTLGWTFAILPWTPLTLNGILFGTVIETVLTSLALGDRVNVAKAEKVRAQEALINEQESAIVRQRRLADSFARFVPREFLELLGKGDITEIGLGDHASGSMTIMFSDIRGFTSLSETLAPKALFDFVNLYFGQISPIVREHGGLVDKYLGDAIMAIFPRSPEDALRAALAMRRRLAEMNGSRTGTGLPAIAAGIGLHTGPLILGTIGEAGRMDTTVISDVVNVASRLEGLTKHYDVPLLMSGDVVAALPATLAAECLYVDRVRVQGRLEPVDLFEPASLCDEDIRQLRTGIELRFRAAVAVYRSGRFAEARASFLALMEAGCPAGPAARHHERCTRLLAGPVPLGWDAVENIGFK